MQNQIFDDNYAEKKYRAEEFYFKLGSVWCPKLNDDVVFRKSGFDHLVWKGSVRRPKSEQMRRFAALIHAEKILKNPDAVLIQEEGEIFHKGKMNKRNMLVISMARFWRFHDVVDGTAIKLVVRQIGNGKKEFFSIFEK